MRDDSGIKVMNRNSKPTPVLLKTTCRVDLSSFPIKVFVEAVPELLFKSLGFTRMTDVSEMEKEIKTGKVHLIFEREVKEA